MNKQSRTIAVVGATGAQGGGLARAILDDPDARFRLRALTRNPASEKAAALAEAGAEVVRADLDDAESLAQAFDGAHGAYCVTNFWEHFSPEREYAQATNMAEAARGAGLQHVVWSTFEDTRRWVPLDDGRMPTLMGMYKVPHFDAKGEANREFLNRGVPVTFLFTSFYWDNFIHLGMGPQRGADGALAFALPMGDKPLPGMWSGDIGKCAFGLFAGGKEYIGKTVGIAGEHPTGEQMAVAFGAALGEPVRYDAIDPAIYRGLGFPGADDLGNMFQFKRDFSSDYCGARSVATSRSLNPDILNFKAWLAKYGKSLPIDKAAG
jgi:uncharacterized protein YbjT (DUF2867 family)